MHADVFRRKCTEVYTFERHPEKGLKDGWGETLILSLAGERTGTMSRKLHRKVLGKHPGSNTLTPQLAWCSATPNKHKVKTHGLHTVLSTTLKKLAPGL